MADKPALLVLEDGTVFRGRAFGASARSSGEVVFSTAMTGYQEMLTDPSFAGQVLVLTYPLAGNYGINREDVESKRIQVRGLVVHEECREPSHWGSEMTLHDYLASEEIPGIAGVDTRALTRKLRTAGVMMGAITTDETVDQALARLRALPRYGETDLVREVSTDEPYDWPIVSRQQGQEPRRRHRQRRQVQHHAPARRARLPGDGAAAGRPRRADPGPQSPDGILFSPGPGDPAFLDYQVATVRALIGKAPVLGICLGHQVLGRAFGAGTFKLKFGHRGANHPVQDVATGRVHITAQNHGYAVDPDGLSSDIEVSQVHLNDGTCEGCATARSP